MLHERFNIAQSRQFGAWGTQRYNTEDRAYEYPREIFHLWVNAVIQIERLYEGLDGGVPVVA